ncbi:MAG: class I SAM-dependent methyltransferase [Planctomycetota bacterium]
MSERNEIVGADYWDRKWRNPAPLRALSEKDSRYGRNGVFRRAMERRLGALAGKTLLEIGGGGPNYMLLSLVKWAGARATVIDYSQPGLELLSRLFERNGCAVEVLLGDALLHDFRERRFDIVTHFGVIEHV